MPGLNSSFPAALSIVRLCRFLFRSVVRCVIPTRHEHAGIKNLDLRERHLDTFSRKAVFQLRIEQRFAPCLVRRRRIGDDTQRDRTCIHTRYAYDCRLFFKQLRITSGQLRAAFLQNLYNPVDIIDTADADIDACDHRALRVVDCLFDLAVVDREDAAVSLTDRRCPY